MHAPKYYYDLDCHCLSKLNLTYTSQQDTQPKKKTNHVPNTIEDSAQQETHNLELSSDNLSPTSFCKAAKQASESTHQHTDQGPFIIPSKTTDSDSEITITVETIAQKREQEDTQNQKSQKLAERVDKNLSPPESAQSGVE